MDAHDVHLHSFLTAGRNYIIPVYQRNYDWKKEHCQKLLQDIIKSADNNTREYFLGSIVITLREDSTSFNYSEYFIIDGQQRLTTIMLLLLAIYHHNSEYAKGVAVGIADCIFSEKNKERKLILKQIQKDDEYLSKVIKNDISGIDDSNIINNYLYFQKTIESNPKIISDIMKGFKKLRIVEIILNENDDKPQLVFETLNATGKELSEADKIRNYILMYKEQEKLYNDYWVKIEDNCLQKNDERNISVFIKHFLIIEHIDKISKPINDNQVYSVFKEYLEKKDNEEVLKLMLIYSKKYNLMLTPNENNKSKIETSLCHIKSLNLTTLNSLILCIFKQNYDEKLSDDTASKMIFLLENYVVRRAIASLPSNVLNKVVFSIIKKMVTKGSEIEIIDAFEQALFITKGSGLFPTNANIAEALKTKPLYTGPSRALGYFLLKQLEIFNTKEKNDYTDITIEHIIPQTLTDEWKKELGNEYQVVYDTYLHTLGNITFTGYNSKLSNKPFNDKKNLIKNTSKFLFLNKEFCDSTNVNWTKEQILERTARLCKSFLEIYPYPDYIKINAKSNNTIESIDITEDIDYDYTSTELLSYEYNGLHYDNIKSWSDFLVQLLGSIYEEDTVKFNARIINNSDFEDKVKHDKFQEKHIHDKHYNAKNGKTLYFNTVQDTNSKVRLINSILEILEIDSPVNVEVKPTIND